MTTAICTGLAAISAWGIYRVYQESSTDRKLRKVIGDYFALINKIRQGQSLNETDREVLSPDCKKILNGQQVNVSREEFINELQTIYQEKGGWVFNPVKTIIIPKENMVVVRFAVKLLGKSYTETAMFSFDKNRQISNIDLTFAEAQGSYQL